MTRYYAIKMAKRTGFYLGLLALCPFVVLAAIYHLWPSPTSILLPIPSPNELYLDMIEQHFIRNNSYRVWAGVSVVVVAMGLGLAWQLQSLKLRLFVGLMVGLAWVLLVYSVNRIDAPYPCQDQFSWEAMIPCEEVQEYLRRGRT